MAWHRESKRHSLARKGIKTAQKIPGLRFIKKPPFSSANRLPVQFGFIVPSTRIDSKGVTHNISDKAFKRRIDEQKKYMDKLFGGDTSVKTIGSYWDGKKVIKEKGVLIQSSMSVEDYEKRLPKLTKHIAQLKKSYAQDSMLVKVEGQDFIYPKKDYIKHDSAQSDYIIVS